LHTCASGPLQVCDEMLLQLCVVPLQICPFGLLQLPKLQAGALLQAPALPPPHAEAAKPVHVPVTRLLHDAAL
jgi:hypothetical protein